MESNTELKPCPFCGGAAEIKAEAYGLNGYRIGCASRPTQYTCPGCIGFSAYYWSEEMAIGSWNRRANEDGQRTDFIIIDDPQTADESRGVE